MRDRVRFHGPRLGSQEQRDQEGHAQRTRRLHHRRQRSSHRARLPRDCSNGSSTKMRMMLLLLLLLLFYSCYCCCFFVLFQSLLVVFIEVEGHCNVVNLDRCGCWCCNEYGRFTVFDHIRFKIMWQLEFSSSFFLSFFLDRLQHFPNAASVR